MRNLEGIFELPPNQKANHQWQVILPIEEKPWNIGLIVGPSGSGKSTIAREAFGESMKAEYLWDSGSSLVDAFPDSMGIKEIVELLSAIGFSSPPSWLKPFQCLSNGEQFRVSIARSLAESAGLTVVDEFTSVVDRTVAQICSASIAKIIRRQGKQFVGVSCHHDIVDWLCPDWVLEMPSGKFTWRSLRRRPDIQLEIRRVRWSAWELFRHHHYLDHSIHKAAKCFCAFIKGRPVAFTGVLFFPHPVRPGWREHRTVCLPDYQGVGIGNAMSEYVASLFSGKGFPYRSTTSNPAMVRHRAKSSLWKMVRKPGLNSKNATSHKKLKQLRATIASTRFTAGFEYVGPSRKQEAVDFGLF